MPSTDNDMHPHKNQEIWFPVQKDHGKIGLLLKIVPKLFFFKSGLFAKI